jgi:hypothetical protein
MNDRELLELAAEAAGIELSDWSSSENGFIRYHFVTRHIWNPLIDDADAFRLAVKLEMDIEITIDPSNDAKWVWVYLRGHALTESCGNDPYAATRRAIVRAAAEIGRSTEPKSDFKTQMDDNWAGLI